jgi:hypothetical protein
MAPAKRSLRLGRQVDGCDNECAVANSVRHVDKLKIPSCHCLTKTYPRMIISMEFLACPTQDLPHFFLGDAVIENVRQVGLWIDPEAKLHSVALSVQCLSSLLRIEPSYKPGTPSPLPANSASPFAADGGHRNWKVPRSGCDRVGHWRARQFTGQILLTDEEPGPRS